MEHQTALALGVAIPLASFFILAIFGHRLGKPAAGYLAVGAVGVSCILSARVLVDWLGMDDGMRAFLSTDAARYEWAKLGDLAITVGVKLDSLTVIMYFMVTFVSFWIFFFSLGYMGGRSDEIDGTSKYHRFFAYLSLFCFSMLGLVVSSSLLFMFIFWELVGLCSYLLIGFYFERKYASDAAIKAFITNRVGDFGFILGLALVVFYLGTLDLDEAAQRFADQYRDHRGIFASPITLFGFSLATLMGIGLFCGAMGKSAQFPLHVWLPDAMAGPTPVSALIHAATMVAAGVYLVARVFRLLTPEAQMFIAVIGCITLTITALIAVVQTDIKKVLAYSTLSQLGYMIFAMGVGAWIAALFHLMTHAFFKAMLFLGSGQVIEGCHHEQDIRKMGGLWRKMPITCCTFFIGVLAIAGFGLPGVHVGEMRLGLGGFFSKDEILAVAYERTYNLSTPNSHDESPSGAGEHAAAGHDPQSAIANPHSAEHHATGTPAKMSLAARLPVLPKFMFWLPIIIAYITPFYMMRCWWLTFCGKPRDEHVYHHAHEQWKMYLPLVVLAFGTAFCSYLVFRPLIADAARIAADSPTIVAFDGEAANYMEAGRGAMVTLHHEHGRNPHEALVPIVGFAWIVGMAGAWLVYRKGLVGGEWFRRRFSLIHHVLVQKLYFDHAYNAVLVAGTVLMGRIVRLFDDIIVDGAVNLSAFFTKSIGVFSGRQLDMPVERHDLGLVDSIANGIAGVVLDAGQGIRRPQNGRIRTYVLIAAGATAALLLFVLFFDQIAAGYHRLFATICPVCEG